MKKKIFALVLLFFPLSFVFADGIEYDRAVSFDRLPAKARSFLQTYYPQAVWLTGKKEIDGCSVEYKVVFKDGLRVEFARNGKWTKLENPQGGIPSDLVPQPIRDFLQDNFPDGGGVYRMERDRREIEVKLRNGMECTFSAKSFLPMEIDR